jgi:predicted RNA binding protein YcfA (HicA-like mRNA interferase family)
LLWSTLAHDHQDDKRLVGLGCVRSSGRCTNRRVSTKPAPFLERVSRADVANVALRDVVSLVEALGFEKQRTSGSDHVYAHPLVAERVNLQEVRGQAKPYQVRQILRLIERYNSHQENGT